MNIFDVNAYSSDEEGRRPKTIRYRSNHFEEWDDIDFLARFRLSKRTVQNVCAEIAQEIAHPTIRNSSVCQKFEQREFGNSVILGDSGYPIKPYPITPLRNTNNKPEALFNESLIRTRNVVERSYGVWKRRFPALALGLRLKLDTTQAVIVATAVLHNLACEENETLPPINNQIEAAIDLVNNVGVHDAQEVNHGGLNNVTRLNLIQHIFAGLG